MAHNKRNGISLVEVLIAITMLSTLALPLGMFIVEYTKGSSDLGDRYQILNLIEEKLEAALALPYNSIPDNVTTNKLINGGREKLDLRPSQVGKSLVNFSMRATSLPVEFSAVRDAYNGQLQNARVENGLKKIIIKAVWGKHNEHSEKLIAYKANL